MNPLKIDPTRTTLLRKSFEKDFELRFNSIMTAVIDLVVKQDVFGLGLLRNDLCLNIVKKLKSGKYRLYSRSGKNLGTFDTKQAALKHEAEVMMFKAMAKNEEWGDVLETIKFLPNSKKAEKFEAWLKTQINSKVMVKVQDSFWMDDYTKKAYQKGVDKAYTAVRRSFRNKEEAEAARREFNSVFNNSSKEKLKLVQARTLTDLKGITSAMSSKISAVIIDGLSKGMSADDIGKAINDRVSKIGLSRAKTLARTEIVRAHAEGSLDAMESLGVKNVGVNVEWATAKKPCPTCAKLAGVVMTIQQARGLFPRHPNCLCSPIPSLQTARIADLRKRISSSVKESPNTEWQGQLLLRKNR